MAHVAEASFCISNLRFPTNTELGNSPQLQRFIWPRTGERKRCRGAISGEGSKDDADVDAVERALAVSPQLSAIS